MDRKGLDVRQRMRRLTSARWPRCVEFLTCTVHVDFMLNWTNRDCPDAVTCVHVDDFWDAYSVQVTVGVGIWCHYK